MISFIIANLFPIVLAALAAFFGGKIYLKGRADARVKADKELQDAYEKVSGVVEWSRDAGNRVSDSELRTDDGYKRK
jgi:hypothetical protein